MRTDAERAAYEAVHVPVFLSPVVYETAKRAGMDMTGFKILRPIPRVPKRK